MLKPLVCRKHGLSEASAQAPTPYVLPSILRIVRPAFCRDIGFYLQMIAWLVLKSLSGIPVPAAHQKCTASSLNGFSRNRGIEPGVVWGGPRPILGLGFLNYGNLVRDGAPNSRALVMRTPTKKDPNLQKRQFKLLNMAVLHNHV